MIKNEAVDSQLEEIVLFSLHRSSHEPSHCSRNSKIFFPVPEFELKWRSCSQSSNRSVSLERNQIVVAVQGSMVQEVVSSIGG